MTSKDPEGKPKKANIRDNHDGTYLVSYVPDMTGRYTILIKYGGDEIPYSPYRIRALPTGDASKCTVTGRRGSDGADLTLNTEVKQTKQTGNRSSSCSADGGEAVLHYIVPTGIPSNNFPQVVEDELTFCRT